MARQPCSGVALDPHAHWHEVHGERAPDDVSWTLREPTQARAWIGRIGAGRILDVGTGATGLPVQAPELGDVVGLDISMAALLRARRAAPRAAGLVAGDIKTWRAAAPVFDIWHDRALFHFLVQAPARAAYCAALASALKPGGHALVATFAPDGPDQCSGLPVARYDADGLAAALSAPALGLTFTRLDAAREVHVTPWGSEQAFTWVLLRRD